MGKVRVVKGMLWALRELMKAGWSGEEHGVGRKWSQVEKTNMWSNLARWRGICYDMKDDIHPACKSKHR
jgi:hypothetical protein